MWLDYMKERFGYESLEMECGFALYSIGAPVLLLNDMYIKPEFRALGKGTELLDQLVKIATDRGCDKIMAQVWTNDRNASATLNASFSRGFLVSRAENGYIVITKKVGA